MWKAAVVMFIAFLGFVLTTVSWGGTLDGRSDPCVAQGVDLCPDDPTTTTASTSTTTTTVPATTAPAAVPAAPTTTPSPPR